MRRCSPGPAAAVAALRDYLNRRRDRRASGCARWTSRAASSYAAIDRASRFLNLASLASVLLAAVAVAMGARRYAARHIDTVALMKCMGASQRFVLSISVIELDAAGARRGGARRLARLPRAGGSRVAAARPHPHRAARRFARARGHRRRDGDRHADRLRAAGAPASQEHAARCGCCARPRARRRCDSASPISAPWARCSPSSGAWCATPSWW